VRRFETGQYYHVFNRGNHKDVIFRDNDDRKYFLSKLDEFCERDDISIHVYCLMDNHYHLVLGQQGHVALPVIMRSFIAGYVHTYNRKYGTVGGLFQGRFKAKHVYDEGYMAQVSRYIHLNPHPFDDYRKYRWSSCSQYTTVQPGICEVGPVLDCFGGSKTSYAIFMGKAGYYGERDKS
jgi:putative transposase